MVAPNHRLDGCKTRQTPDHQVAADSCHPNATYQIFPWHNRRSEEPRQQLPPRAPSSIAP